MGAVLAEAAALSLKPEVAYGTEVVPTDNLLFTEQPELTHDDSFDDEEYISLSASSLAPDRQHNKLDLSATGVLGPMNDIINGFIAESLHALMIASGHAFTQHGTAGTGNFIEYTPKSTGIGSATGYAYRKERTSGLLSVLKHIGLRVNWALQIQPGSKMALACEGSALHSFPAPFSAATAPATQGGGLGGWAAKCLSATIDGEDVKLISFELNRGLDVGVDEDDVTACNDGIAEILADAGNIEATLVIEYDSALIATSGTTNHIYASHAADVDHEVIITRDDGDQIWTLTMPKVRFLDMQEGAGDRNRTWEIQCRLQPTSGDDEYAMRWEVI
jgi:hypothetical protein